MTGAHNRFPRKRRVNITLSEDLIDGAKRQGINLSEFIERRIEREIRAANMREFCAEHEEAIGQMADRIESEGTFGERHGVIRKYLAPKP